MCKLTKLKLLGPKMGDTVSRSVTTEGSCSSEFAALNSVLETNHSTSSITVQMRAKVREMLRAKYSSPSVNQSLEILFWNTYTNYTEAGETELAEMAMQCILNQRARRGE